MYFHYFFNKEKDETLHLNNFEFRHPGMHCAKIGWNWPIGYGEDFKNFVNVVLLVPLEKKGGVSSGRPNGSGGEDFKMLSMYFCYFAIIPTCRKGMILYLLFF